MKLFVVLLLSFASSAWANPVTFDFQKKLIKVSGVHSNISEIRRARAEYIVSKLVTEVKPDGSWVGTNTKICEGMFEVGVFEGHGSIYVDPAFSCSSTFEKKSVDLTAFFVMIQDGQTKNIHGFGMAHGIEGMPQFTNQFIGTDVTNKVTSFGMVTYNEAICNSSSVCAPKYKEQFHVHLKIID